MARFGLDVLISAFPGQLSGKRVGVVCHAASVDSSYRHVIDVIAGCGKCTLAAVFGPQHGLFGQTQDNMVEWEGNVSHPLYGVPVYSLYGEHRKPTPKMLDGLDALIFDVQDVGARPYTYVWTLKHCMEACAEKGMPVWVLDRPNPIGVVGVDGPMLSPDFFSFVGGGEIPLCHRMTMGEMGLFIKKMYVKDSDLNIVWMDGWVRGSLWSDTGLPWVLPSPNMPTLDTAIVYPGQVLLEATNISEARGTTRPFELWGAPFINAGEVIKILNGQNLPGCLFREHGFIPTFQKWAGQFCGGVQIHVTDPKVFRPVQATAALLGAVIKLYGGQFKFKDPPYEYEYKKMPFDILAGDTGMRESLLAGESAASMRAGWEKDYPAWDELFKTLAHYPEKSA
ncbi:MAG: DUF1343 domain-containing protein [Chitinispirillia bacterium]|nr:DUF1343 domain-containing protein [Chitinispirillia bacterium]MCL2241636.1 DUF1343 domain-containing protein [Chitinispirillia bacterium]